MASEPQDLTESFSFLVTTDNHMGYKYDDHLRRRDSFMAFKEALQLARERDVDFILLGGDLFHMNKPNPTIEHKCIKILRHHMNAQVDKKCASFRRTAGEFSHYDQVKHGNFEDSSLTVPYPIMTIHGNHDDPIAPAGKSVVEKLATCGLLNYFGKLRLSHSEKAIRIEPIIFEKGTAKVALYGIGFIPDRKLRTAWDQGQVHFKEPPRDTFNVLIVHQNRRPYEQNKCIPDSYFPKWFHLVIRGHEHDAMAPEILTESQVNGLVYQPGSTVATSMEVRESTAKQVALMRVLVNDPRGDQLSRYKLQPEIIDLKCHRRMIFKDIYQKEIFDHIKATDTRRKLTQVEYRSIFRSYVVKQVDALLADAERERESRKSDTEVADGGGAKGVASATGGGDSSTGTPGQSQQTSCSGSVYSKLDRFRLPLVRLRLEYKHKVECFDDLEVNALFYPAQVANRDIIKFRQQRLILGPDGSKKNVTFDDDLNTGSANADGDDDDSEEYGMGPEVEAIDLHEERRDTVDALIMDYFSEKPPAERLKAISLDEYTEAVRSATEEGNVISRVLAKKKNAILFQYKSQLTDEKMAAQHFGLEAKVQDWFMRAFKGEKMPPLSVGGDRGGGAGAPHPEPADQGNDDSDDVDIIWDDDFKE